MLYASQPCKALTIAQSHADLTIAPSHAGLTQRQVRTARWQKTVYLIEAVAAALGEEDLDIGVTQQVILGCPLDDPDIAAHRQLAAVQLNDIGLCQLPDHFGWGNCRQPLGNGLELCCLCRNSSNNEQKD